MLNHTLLRLCHTRKYSWSNASDFLFVIDRSRNREEERYQQVCGFEITLVIFFSTLVRPCLSYSIEIGDSFNFHFSALRRKQRGGKPEATCMFNQLFQFLSDLLKAVVKRFKENHKMPG